MIVIAVLVGSRDAERISEINEVRSFGEIGYSEVPVSGYLTVGRQLGRGRKAQLSTDGRQIGVMLEDAAFAKSGACFDIHGVLYLPARVRNPGQFSQRDFWQTHYLAAGLRVDEFEARGEQGLGLIFRLAEELREWMREAITAGLEQKEHAHQIILAMVMGEAPGFHTDITKAFRFSGAMHVFAVSGLHVNLVATLFFFGFMVVGVSRRKAIFAVIIIMVLYAMVTGFRPPAVRASLMTSIFLSAFLLRRRPSLFNALAMSLILVVLWQPAQVREIGFQLSYGVLASIGVGFHFFHRFTSHLAQEDPMMPKMLLSWPARGFLWLRRYVAAALATSIPAWIGSLPLMAIRFGLITPVSIFASVILIPLTFIVLSLGLCSAFCSTVSKKAGLGLNQLNGQTARIAYKTANFFSNVPGASWKMPSKAPADLIVFDTSDGGAASYWNHHGGVLIDVGSEAVFQRMVRPALTRWSAPVGRLVLTHPDGRHAGAVNLAQEFFSPDEVLIPVSQARSPAYRDLVKRDHNLILMRAEGHEWDWLKIVKEGVSQDLMADDRGVVVKLNYKGWRILFTGDAGFETEEELLEKDIGCDLVVMGRHGEHGYSGTAPFLKATGAQVIIISGGHFPATERVPTRWREMVASLGIELFWQKQTGGVYVKMEEGQCRVWSHLQPEKEVFLSR